MPSYVVLDSAIAPANPVIQVSGTRYYRAGDTDIPPTHLFGDIQGTAINCDDGLSPPATCPTCGLAAFYRITDLSGLSTAACTTCKTATGTAWNGKLGPGPASGVFGDCTWLIYASDSGGILGGKVLLAGSSGVGLSGNWALIIKCPPQNEEGVAAVIWQGTKTTGRTPAGVYSRTGGCSAGPAALTLEAVPL